MDGFEAELVEKMTLLTTGVENTYNLMSLWKKYNDVAAFLYSQEYLRIRSTTVSTEEQAWWLQFSCDIDGVTIEWERLGGTSHTFHHLYIAPRDASSLKKVFPMLKKHDNLVARNATSLRVIESCVGTQLLYDSGWEYYLCLLPDVQCNIDYTENVIRALTLKWLKEVRLNMVLALNRCLETGMIPGTLDKNNINDCSKLFILPRDSGFVLDLFDKCVSETVPPQCFKACLFSFRFGEKNSSAVQLPIRDNSSVLRVCVHSAVVIELEDDEDGNVLWSREGIRSVVGHHGSLTCAMSFSECSNFQSNLDGRPIDIQKDLRNVCAFPSRVHFVQLYTDLPHRYPNTRFHPVSAAIMIGRGLTAHTKHLDADAAAYVSEIQSNCTKIRKSRCRMEFVLSLPDVVDSLNPQDFFIMSNLQALIAKHPLLVPFIGCDVSKLLREVGLFCSQELSNLLHAYIGSGHSEAVWQAYQCEIAVEKLLWGKPFCWRSNQHAINLGIGLGHPTRSLTDGRGFLCLADKFSSCADENFCPPLQMYSNNPTVQKQMQKMFGFADYLDGSPSVLGRRLLMVMLEDFHDNGVIDDTFNAFYARLKQSNVGMKVCGSATLNQICEVLTCCSHWKPPMISHHLLAVLQSKGKNVEEILKEGIHEIGIRYFPAVRKRDGHGNAGLNWSSLHGVWLITETGTAISCLQKASMMCPLIVTQLEAQKLCHTSKLVGSTDTFPWVLPVLRKLRCRNLEEKELIKILTFITCIAFLQGGRYVNYQGLSRLEIDMSLSQRDLRNLEVLGKFILTKVNTGHFWSLHHSIPSASAAKESRGGTRASSSIDHMARQNQPVHLHVETDLPRINDAAENVLQGDSVMLGHEEKHIPNGVYRKWSSQELGIVGYLVSKSDGQHSVSDMYTRYVAECRTAGIPDRSFAAFKRKANRLRK